MKIFRTVLGVLLLLLGILIIGERIYYSYLEIKTLYSSVPIIIFGFLLIYHRSNTTLFSEGKKLKSLLTIVVLITSTFVHGYFQSVSCISKNCDYTVGYPLPVLIATDTNIGLLGIVTIILGIFLNYIFYYLLLSLVIRAFKKKTSSNFVH